LHFSLVTGKLGNFRRSLRVSQSEKEFDMNVPLDHIPSSHGSAVSMAARITLLILCVGLSASAQTPTPTAPTIPAQTTPKDDPEQKRAHELFDSGKFVEAMPLFEKLAADHPSDALFKERWAFSTMAYARTLSDPELRKKARAHARIIAIQARELGDNSNLLQVVLDLPEDGSELPFSDRKDVDDAMKAAEADFSRGDLDKARDGYLHVMMLDPNNYEAALFIGDVYFKQHINGSAGEWFARAVQIDPNRETAYRYWGDALWTLQKSADAREKYIQAIVAEPYNQRSWTGLNQWADRAKVALNWVRLQDKSAVTQKDEKNVNITLDNGLKKDDPNMTAWLTYAIGRASWRGDKFKKEFPNEPKYRRTMREEADSLHLMVTVLGEQKDFEKKKKDLDPALLQLVKIDQAGFIEPFALLNRVDGEIAQDYPAYRAANRDKVYRYFDEFVVPKAPAQ
jgi:tetratricopeptide (TPR) repeat protein